MASVEFDLTLTNYRYDSNYQENDAASFDIRRSGKYEEPFMTSAPVFTSQMDENELLRSSGASVELFSNDSVLLTQRPVPTLDYFVDLPVIVEHNLETTQVDSEDAEASDASTRVQSSELEPQKPQVAEIVYVDDTEEARPLTQRERQHLEARALARERKLKRNAENRLIAQKDSVKHVFQSSVTHVKDPAQEIHYTIDESPWWSHKRGVGIGNAVKLSARGKWVPGIVSGVNDSGTRVAISWKGISSSWYRRGKVQVFSTVLSFDSPDWYPIRTKTIPGTARRGRPAKVDDYLPEPRQSEADSESYGSSHSYPTYRSTRAAPPPDSSEKSITTSEVPRKSKAKEKPLTPPVEVEKPRRFKFQPGAQQEDGDVITDDSYAQRKLERQKQRYAKYEEFLQRISKGAPIFRVRVVLDHEARDRNASSDDDDASQMDPDDAISTLVAPIAFAPTVMEPQNNDLNFPPRASIFFDRVDGVRGILGDNFDSDALFQLSSSGEDTFFTEIDERSRQLFDEYMEFAIADALNSSSEDFDLNSSSGSLSRSLSTSGDLEADEMLLRDSGSLAFVNENSSDFTPIPTLPDKEMLQQLNDGIYAPEESNGFDVDGLLKHYSYIVSAPEKKRKPRDLLDAPPTAQERTLVIENAPEPQFHVLDSKSSLKAVLQPSITDKDVTAIPEFEDRRAQKMIDISTKPLNAREILFASEDSLVNDLKSQVRVFFDGISLEELHNNHFSHESHEDDSQQEDESSHNTEPSLTDPSAWKFETDLLITKAEESPESQQANSSGSWQRGRGVRQARKPSVSSETSKSSSSAVATSAPSRDRVCEICRRSFRDQFQMSDHLSSRLHRDNVWRHKQVIAAEKNAALAL